MYAVDKQAVELSKLFSFFFFFFWPTDRLPAWLDCLASY